MRVYQVPGSVLSSLYVLLNLHNKLICEVGIIFHKEENNIRKVIVIAQGLTVGK